MSTPLYDALVAKVRDWANRDSTVLSDSIVNDALDYAADFSALVYDPQWYNIATLRALHETEVGQAGDSTIGQIVEECSLEVRNPTGCGLIVGLAG